MNKLFLYNTLTRQKQEFAPLKKGRVSLYTCGPTVYNYAHIGNLRTYIFEDILRRVLEYNNYKVKQVMNITDVGHLTSDADTGEDKLEKGAAREHKSVWEIADFYTKAFQENLKDLNIKEPSKWCKATDYIKQQIKLVKILEKNGFTYKTSDGIYFDSFKYPDYAKLARLNLEGQREGARVGVNNEKRNPTDFALWKFSPTGQKRQMEWPSPWGIGFPGWHLECSAISMKELGDEFDLHCGGIDHIPIHHTNERAQNWGVTGKEVVHYWLHGEFLVINEEKMAKSENNFITLNTLKEKGINPLVYRYFCLSAHYRSKLNFSWEALEQARDGMNGLYRAIADYEHQPQPIDKCQGSVDQYRQEFISSINDDLNIPKALSVLHDLLNSNIYPKDKVRLVVEEFDEVLGLQLYRAKSYNPFKPDDDVLIADKIREYRELRNRGVYEESDILRKKIEIIDLGYQINDMPGNGIYVVKKFF